MSSPSPDGVLDRPALLDPLAERRAVALGELLHDQRAEVSASASAQLSLEGTSVRAPVERASPVDLALAEADLVVPASVLVCLGMDAHRARPLALRLRWRICCTACGVTPSARAMSASE